MDSQHKTKFKITDITAYHLGNHVQFSPALYLFFICCIADNISWPSFSFQIDSSNIFSYHS